MRVAISKVWLSTVTLLVIGLGICVFIYFQPSNEEKGEYIFLHGLWVDTYFPGLKSKEEADRLLNDTQSMGINSLFVQTRRRGDLIFNSKIEPNIFKHDNWDPVSYLRTKSDGLQLNAWVVCGPVWNQKEFDRLPENHVLIDHPDWIMLRDDGESFKDGEYFLDLGLPEVQKHLMSVIAEIAASGKFQGIHLDYIRYPGRRWGYHPKVLEEFYQFSKREERPAPDDPLWMSFRRQKITDLVELVFAKIKSINPELILSAATITYAPGPTKQRDWLNSSAYGYLFQDWRAWIDQEIVDWVIPMVYFKQEVHAHNFNKWIRYLAQSPNSKRIAIGFGLFLNDKTYNLQQISNTFFSPKSEPNFLGYVGYSYAYPKERLEGTNSNFIEDYPFIPIEKRTRDLSDWKDVIPPAAFQITRDRNDKRIGHLGVLIHPKKDKVGPNSYMVELYKGNKFVRKLDLNATGFCFFRNIPPGQYSIKIFQKSNHNKSVNLLITISKIKVDSGNVFFLERKI